MMGIFAERVKYTVQEGAVNTLLQWSYKNDRADLALVIFMVGVQAGLLGEGYKLAPKFKKFILAEYPSAFYETSIVHFSVEIEEVE